ncbi:hypothetical protein ACROYT_G021622 [Oculina patagonica]
MFTDLNNFPNRNKEREEQEEEKEEEIEDEEEAEEGDAQLQESSDDEICRFSKEMLPSLALNPTIHFILQPASDPVDVSSQSQSTVVGKEPEQAPTVSEGRELMDSLLETIVKCMQIQNSLHRLVLLKLGRHASVASGQLDALAEHTGASDFPEARQVEGANDDLNYVLGTLLCDLKNPLEALMRCAEIQSGLFQRMITVNLMSTEETTGLSERSSSACDSQETLTETQVNVLTVQSKLEGIAFDTHMECSYARNPFNRFSLKAATSKDVIQLFFAAELPHGHGSLYKTTDDNLIYSGDWYKGKRHGKGEGLILSLPCNSPATPGHGFYSGEWKNNMRHGSGKMTFASGAVYEGQWQYDKMTGYGTLKFPDGSVREGTWNEGSLDGCVIFTWPHGVTEYREYEKGQGQLSSCTIDKTTAGKMSQVSSTRSQLLTSIKCITKLKGETLSLKEQLNKLKIEQAEMNRKHQVTLVQREQDYQNLQEKFDKNVTEAKESHLKSAERIHKLEKELEHSKGAQLCQICFERPRDCIIMPCTHFLYCRNCVTEHKRKGDSRCPTCRGPIAGEMLCNINH